MFPVLVVLSNRSSAQGFFGIFGFEVSKGVEVACSTQSFDWKRVLKPQFLSRYSRQGKASRGSFGVRFSGRNIRFSVWATRFDDKRLLKFSSCRGLSTRVKESLRDCRSTVTIGVFGFVGFFRQRTQSGS